MSKPKPLAYVYRAKVLSVYDGDTLTANLDLGMSLSMKVNVRLAGIDTPEMSGKADYEKELATKARDRLRALILGKDVTLHSLEEPDKYGRLLADIWHGEVHVNQIMLDENLARPYDGGKKASWDPGTT